MSATPEPLSEGDLQVIEFRAGTDSDHKRLIAEIRRMREEGLQGHTIGPGGRRWQCEIDIEKLEKELKAAQDLLLERARQAEELTAEVEYLKAQVEREHECAGELREGLSKQFADSAKELDEKDAEIKRLKIDIAGRSEIVLIEQHEKEVALLQLRALKMALQNMVGMFGEMDTRLKLGNGFTEMHQDAVRSAKDALDKLEASAVEAPKNTTQENGGDRS
jgi:predicted RNase H-like nuclease (RuvC/YqgF family)